MSPNHKDFAIAAALAAIILGSAATVYGLYQKQESGTLKAVVYTTNLSDTLGTFRTEVNSSTANLNAELEAVSSTVITLTQLTNVLPVANGGLGTTTAPTDGQFISANGTSPAWKTLIFTAGLNATETPTSVLIGTTGFNSALNIAFTGNNTHAGTEMFNATTTFSATSTIFTNAKNGLVITDQNGAVSSLATGTAGNIVIASGTTWSSYPFPALAYGFASTSSISCANGSVTNAVTSTVVTGAHELFMVASADSSGGSGNIQLYVDGSAVGQVISYNAGGGGGTPSYGLTTSYVTTVTAGTHNVNIRCEGSGGTQAMSNFALSVKEMY